VCASALWAAVGVSGCFDSDERWDADPGEATVDASTTSGPVRATEGPASESTSSSSGTAEDSAGNPDWTCEDGIRCVQRCISDLLLGGLPPDPDLSCIIECIEMLTVREAYAFLVLSNCVADVCEAAGQCAPADEGDPYAGSDATDLPFGTCLNCMRIRIGNADLPGCETEHALCE